MHTKCSKPPRETNLILLICRICKNDTNELIQKTEIDPQTEKTNLWLPKEIVGVGGRVEGDKLGVSD